MGIEAAFFGILTRDAESKVSGAGKPYLRIIGLRIGEGDKAQWASVTAFDKDAIATADKFVKGAAVYIEGRLTLDKWKTTGGEDRSGLSVMSWHCRLSQIGRNKQKRTRHTGSPSVAAGVADFGAGQSGDASASPERIGADQAKPRADFDDDLPF
jgi:single-stranded DNA-binding protein